MEVRYKSDFSASYMLVEIPEEVERLQYSFKMLEKNRIEGVLTSKERMEDAKAYLYIDISGKKSLLQEYKDKEIELEDMIQIFQQILPILDELKKYLLSEKMVLFEPEYLFRDMEDGRLYITVLPWEREDGCNLRKLAEFFLEKMQQKDEHGINAAYHFYKQQSRQNFSLYHFIPVLEKENIMKRQKNSSRIDAAAENKIPEDLYQINFENQEVRNEDSASKGEGEKEKGKNYLVMLFFVFAVVVLLFGHFSLMKKTQKMVCLALSLISFITGLILKIIVLLKGKKKGKEEINIKETEDEKNIISEKIIEETVFYDSDSSDEIFKLEWKEKGKTKRAVLRDLPCTVGKIEGDVSIVIENPSVSRIHCRFIEKDTGIAIMDLNSTNGTYLNGIRIGEGEILEIVKNDEILIGKVKVIVV